MGQSSTARAREQLVELIGKSVFQALSLKESLESERLALEAGDTESLFAALDIKGRCVDELQSLEQQRRACCAQLGFEQGPAQMQQIIDWCDQEFVIANGWQHLIDIASECNALNLTNGAIIRGRKSQVESGLAVLRGNATDSATYDRHGPMAPDLPPRSLAEA